MESTAPPDPPIDPYVKDITKSTITIAWKVPEYLGGSKLLGYFIEFRTVN